MAGVPGRGDDEMRVEQLAAAADLSVDTVRYYQSRGLLPAGRREGRIAWYGAQHLVRLRRIRELADRGLTLATIGRLLSGELDSADEALAGAVAAASAPLSTAGDRSRRESVGDDSAGARFGIAELARRTGIPVPLLQAVVREGLFTAGQTDEFGADDVETAAAGLRLLEAGLPLPEVLALARRHHQAMREIAEEAVNLFDQHIRHPLKEGGLSPEDAAMRLVGAFQAVLPATMTIVGHHFQRTLLAVALEHIERVGDEPELAAVRIESRRLGA
jgi:DNA-binding transcriptional MerR regulator